MGALPAGWHMLVDPTYQRPYYFNTVTQQSQWTFPTAAAAVPLPSLPRLDPRSYSPGAQRRVGKEFGGVNQIAASYNLVAPAGAPAATMGHSPLRPSGLNPNASAANAASAANPIADEIL